MRHAAFVTLSRYGDENEGDYALMMMRYTMVRRDSYGDARLRRWRYTPDVARQYAVNVPEVATPRRY